jgi:hypothetical protein
MLRIGSDSDSDATNDDDEDPPDENLASYLVHKMILKKGDGFISSENWTRLSAETRRTPCDMLPKKQEELCASLLAELHRSVDTREVNTTQLTESGGEGSIEDGSGHGTRGGELIIQLVIRVEKRKHQTQLLNPRRQAPRRQMHTLLTVGQ